MSKISPRMAAVGIVFIVAVIYFLGERRRDDGVVTEATAVARPGFSFVKICPRCEKPNALSKEFCTGCGGALSARDIEERPDNPFLEVIAGTRDQQTVRLRTDELLVFDDRFGASHALHIQVIPLADTIKDITELSAAHLELLDRMLAAGLEVIDRWAAERGHTVAELLRDELVFSGFNHPVSVRHLHLHFILPPFKHDRIFDLGGPRWHPLAKVLGDLKTAGSVQLYADAPAPAETKRYYDAAIARSRAAPKWLSEPRP